MGSSTTLTNDGATSVSTFNLIAPAPPSAARRPANYPFSSGLLVLRAPTCRE